MPQDQHGEFVHLRRRQRRVQKCARIRFRDSVHAYAGDSNAQFALNELIFYVKLLFMWARVYVAFLRFRPFFYLYISLHSPVALLPCVW